MRVIKKKTLREFWGRFPDAEEALQAWHAEAEAATWKSPADIKARFPSSSILQENRVVFNIRGNKYRLVTKIHYNTGTVFIRFVGTHAEYDKIDAATI